MNDLMSFGLHRWWKRFAIDLCDLRKGQTVLDLAGGTGDLSERISRVVGDSGRIINTDINAAMLKVGRRRLMDKGCLHNIKICQANAEELPFPDNCFDRIIIGFGLRNVTNKARALASMQRALKPGGRCLVLEFSKPKLPALKPIYDFYSFNVLPKLGKLVANDADSYRYLAESIRMHPDQDTLKTMMLNAGFDQCDVHNLAGGIVAIHRGVKY